MFKILSIFTGITTLCFSDTLPFALQNNNWLDVFQSYFQLDPQINTQLKPASYPQLLYSLIALSLFFLLLRFFLVKLLLIKLLPVDSLHSRNKTRLKTIFDTGLLFLLAAIYAQSIAQSQLNSRLPDHLDGSDIVITGTVVGLVERHELDSYRQQSFYQRFLFKVNQFDNKLDANKKSRHYKPRIIQINNYKYLDIQSGQQWQFTVRLKKPRGNSNPGGFDYVRYLFSQRINATGYIRSIEHSQLINQGHIHWLTGIRDSRVKALLKPLSKLNNEGLLKALLLGDRSDLNPNDKQLLKRTGTSHLLAISGLHIGVAALFAALLVKGLLWLLPLTMHYKPRVLIIAIAALPIATFYAIVAGFSLSTRRALIMLGCFLVMILLRRQTHLLQTLSIAALIIVIIDPLSVLSAGFWFSFSAVAILLWASRAMRFSNKASTNDKSISTPSQLTSTSTSSWSIWIASSREKLILFGLAQMAIFIAMPLVLSLFTGQGSLLTPIANLLAIPIVSLTVVPAGIAGLLTSYISLTVAEYFFAIADFFLNWILVLLNWLESFARNLRHGPFNIDMVSYQPSLTPLLFGITFISIIILLGKRGVPAYAAAAIIWIAVFNPLNFRINTQQLSLQEGDIILTQLDVGQGSAILLSTRNYHLLYDTGPRFSEASNAASNIIEPYLATMGIKALDTVIVSHGDNDHSGGANYLNEYGNVKDWLLGGSANVLPPNKPTNDVSNVGIESNKGNVGNIDNIKETRNYEPNRCRAGQQWQRDGITFEIIHPSTVQFSSENDQSCVLRVVGKHSDRALALLTGDISRRVESHLVSTSRSKLSSDLLTVPHHGSASSSSIALISASQPSVALVSAGHRNRYRHPHPRVTARYLDRDIPIYRSDKLGAVQFIYRSGEWKGPYCAKFNAEHFWQDFNHSTHCIGSIKP